MNESDRNTINVGDITLSYYRKGNGKKALILLHGNSENAKIFSDYLNTVSEDYKAYAIDLRGHGKSQWGEGNFTIKTMAIDIMRFINQKPFDKVSIVGFSDGANIAMYLAKIAPELIDKLVLISGNLFVKALAKPFFYKIRFRYKLNKPFGYIIKRARLRATKMALMLDNIGVYPDDLNNFDFPVLVIDAQNDLIAKEHTSLIVRSIPNAKHITIEGADHFTIMKNPRLFEAVNQFLNQ
ncbi:MAG: alpha/beta fold hydrolase [Christensenellales bacterium]|jgi:pimeloyl-ACP methyl ester carboxylesterase|nr:alpha/beta hydrolase [Clostridiales bacterium]